MAARKPVRPRRAATRVESDSFGDIEIPADALWGAQTARSLRFFAIGCQPMPVAVVHALAWIKWAAACVNRDLLLLDAQRARAIVFSAWQVAVGGFDREFPLSVWQTGSGTQSHMNVNEVIANLASAMLGKTPDKSLYYGLSNGLIKSNQNDAKVTPVPGRDGQCSLKGAGARIHANDEVNLGQSSNDVFPSAIHIAVALRARHALLPALSGLRQALGAKALAFSEVVKIGRTHLQDATPLTLGQEFGGYAAQLALCEASTQHALGAVHRLAIGGTAVGTGLNTHAQFGPRVAALLALQLDLPLKQADNLFAAQAGHEALVAFHASLKMLAIALTKIGNDIRLMGSGPRAGFGELQLPENEPGSSIMPGKVNPTQIEALAMVCAQVMGHDCAIGFAASQGQFELNAYQPLIAFDTLDSVTLLADAMRSFTRHCVAGIRVNHERVAQLLKGSLMLVTALTPHIGYERAAQIAKQAHEHGGSLREAALSMGTVSAEQFDAWVDPRLMLGPHSA